MKTGAGLAGTIPWSGDAAENPENPAADPPADPPSDGSRTRDSLNQSRSSMVPKSAGLSLWTLSPRAASP